MTPQTDRSARAVAPTPVERASSVFELVADRRRRLLLVSLAGSDRAATLDQLARTIAMREADSEVALLPEHADPPGDLVRSIAINLHHVHVPVLAEAGAVAYDRSTNAVRLCEAGERLVSRLDVIRGSPRDE